MDKKELIIIGIVIVIFIVVAGVMLSPSTGAKDTELKMLNNGTLGENGTIYIKLTDAQKQSLADKPVTVKITDKSGKEVLSKTVKTHVTGVAIVKLAKMSPGEYEVKVSYDGDNNYTASSLKEKINVKSGYVEEDINMTAMIGSDTDTTDTQTASPDTSTDSYNSYTPDYSDTSQDSSDTRSDDDDSGTALIDENGNEAETVIDENGHEVPET